MMKKVLFAVIVALMSCAPGVSAKKTVSITDSVNAVVASEAIGARKFLFQATQMVYQGFSDQVLPATNYMTVDGDQVVIQVSATGAPEVRGSFTQSGVITKWTERVKKNGDRSIDLKVKTLSRVVDVNLLVYADSNEAELMVSVHSKLYMRGTVGRLNDKKIVEGYLRP